MYINIYYIVIMYVVLKGILEVFVLGGGKNVKSQTDGKNRIGRMILCSR